MPADADKLKRDLQGLGLSDSVISAAWPDWWSDDAECPGRHALNCAFSLARKLGLDPRSLFEGEEPRFVWRDETKFKRLSIETEKELSAISAFGGAIGRVLVSSTKPNLPLKGLSAKRLRETILAKQTYVRLVDLLGVCWSMGIPVVHLRVFPLPAKRMCAMTVRVNERYAVLLGKDAEFPAPIAFYLAHEIGHIALDHIKNEGSAIVDLQNSFAEGDTDSDEIAADKFALELLTGTPEIVIDTKTRRYTAAHFAETLLSTASQLRVEPGTLALCFGHSLGEWAKANAAIEKIYAKKQPVWSEINGVAARELDWSAMSRDFAFFMQAVMGGIPKSEGSN